MNLEIKTIVPWHHQDALDVLDNFESTADGLSEAEAQKRLVDYGLNELPRKKPRTVWRIFFTQFKNPFIIILLLAAVISFLLSEWLDVFVIVIAVLINTILGFFEEYKADRSLESLRKFLNETSKVRREGKIKIIQTSKIVPGDVILLSAGDKISADARITLSQTFEVNEAPLTGESMPIKKSSTAVEIGVQVSDQSSMVFTGTTVVAGYGEAVVTGTGLNTQIGQIVSLVSEVKEEATPLQRQLAKFARYLGAGILLIATSIFVFGSVTGVDVIEIFRISVALAVAAVPEGLIVAVTVILAIGMQRILKRKALVRRLIAAETLGSVSVICADKTGTLTTGEMSVEEIRIDGEVVDRNDRENSKLHKLQKSLWLTSATVLQIDELTGVENLSGSPTEIALMNYLLSVGEATLPKPAARAQLIFDSKNKFSAALYEEKGTGIIYAVGAPEVLLEKSLASDSEKNKLNTIFTQMSEQGLRVIGVAESRESKLSNELTVDDVKDLSILGFVGLRDPLRPEAVRTIAEAIDAGLFPVMITGDHQATAQMIAQEVGLGKSVLTGQQMDELTDDQLYDRLTSISVYARVMPKHKLRIIRAWQKRGATVAMTGDGVNDAPALKAADIGIALGSGTEVAKETSDIVLLDNNFKTIIDAIREGRIIFDNIRKMIVYLLSDSFSEIILVAGALLFALPLPILPAQILWINLITDGFPSIALTFEPGEPGIMKEPPRKKGEGIMNKEMLVLIFIIGILTDLMLFGIYFYLLERQISIEEIRTFIFVALGVDSLIYCFAVRKFRTSIFHSNILENRYLLAGVVLGFMLLILPLIIEPLRKFFEFHTLTLLEWLILLGLAIGELLLVELIKLIFNHQRNHQVLNQK